MHHTTLGRTGLRVSAAGIGTGGFSRLGLKTGLSEEQSAGLIHEAYDLGVNFIDTAPSYGTEGVVGKALKTLPRDKVVVATKAQIGRGGNFLPAARVVESLDKSLAAMGIDTIDVFNLHGIEPAEYDHAINVIAPALLREKEKGKIRHIGLTENPITDFTNATLSRALHDGVWEVVMVGFSMLHQKPRERVFPLTQQKGIGTLLMFAVRSIFADPPRIAREMRAMVDQGLIDKSLGQTDDPLGFLVHAAGASNVTEAAYRYVRHEPGVDVVLFGTGSARHLRENIAAINAPPLPEADRARLKTLFGHLENGVGLDGHGGGTR